MRKAFVVSPSKRASKPHRIWPPVSTDGPKKETVSLCLVPLVNLKTCYARTVLVLHAEFSGKIILEVV